jgi:predicted ribosome quality control (RQC) complex YloA/Tae2 family protein
VQADRTRDPNKRKEEGTGMRRLETILVLLSVLALGLQGCGDEEKGDAAAKWSVFQTEQIETIQASCSGEGLAPHDFESSFLEVKDLPYRFKGLIRFKKGNVFQEQSYAFVDGSWAAVKYIDPKDKKAEKERQQQIEKIEKEIKELNKEIEKNEKDLLAYKERLESLELKKTEAQELQAALEELKGNM